MISTRSQIVHDRVGQFAVRNDDEAVVVGANARRADSDPLDPPLDFSRDDPVAALKRTINRQNSGPEHVRKRFPRSKGDRQSADAETSENALVRKRELDRDERASPCDQRELESAKSEDITTWSVGTRADLA